MIYHLCLQGLDIPDMKYSVLLPDEWTDNDVASRFHCDYDK